MGAAREVLGVGGRPRGAKGRESRQDAVYDRGPRHLTGLEGDYVHSVGLMNAGYMFAVRSFVLALDAYRRRTGGPWAEVAAALGITERQVHRLRAGADAPSHATMLRLRELMCGDQIPSSHKVGRHTHRT